MTAHPEGLFGIGPIRPDARLVPLSGGRTNRVWRVEQAGETLVAKLYAPHGENPMFPNMPGAEFDTLSKLSSLGLAPEPVGLFRIDLGDVLVYRHLNGSSWEGDARPVARALAKLHGLEVDLSLRLLTGGSAALIAQIEAITEDLPENALPPRPEMPDVPPVQVPRLIHTDVVPGNIVMQGDRAVLIDWQCPALGDPVEDMASFLSPAMQMLYGRAPLDGSEVEMFLDAYSDPGCVARYRALRPLLHYRIAAYCAWSVDRGRPEYGPAMEAELAVL